MRSTLRKVSKKKVMFMTREKKLRNEKYLPDELFVKMKEGLYIFFFQGIEVVNYCDWVSNS